MQEGMIVDGVVVRTVNLYSPTQQWQDRQVASGLVQARLRTRNSA